MSVKTTGAEFKRFHADADWWGCGSWFEDEEIEVDGRLVEDFSIDCIPDAAKVKISYGIVRDLPGVEKGNEPSLESFFRRWNKAQNTVMFVVECSKEDELALKAAIRSAGGKIK